MMRKKRVAIIGCGGRSQGHFQAYQRMPGVEIAGCCDFSAQAREAFELQLTGRCGKVILNPN